MDENTYLLIGNVILSILTLGFQAWGQIAPRLRSSTCCCGRDTVEFGTPALARRTEESVHDQPEHQQEQEREDRPVRKYRDRRSREHDDE